MLGLLHFMYAFSLGAGGVMGYLKKQSMASLLTGGVSCALLLAWTSSPRKCFFVAFTVASIMLVRIGSTDWRKVKFMPAGMVLTMSIAMSMAYGYSGWFSASTAGGMPIKQK